MWIFLCEKKKKNSRFSMMRHVLPRVSDRGKTWWYFPSFHTKSWKIRSAREWISIATRSTCTLHICIGFQYSNVGQGEHAPSLPHPSPLPITYSQRGSALAILSFSQFRHHVSFFFFQPSFQNSIRLFFPLPRIHHADPFKEGLDRRRGDSR